MIAREWGRPLTAEWLRLSRRWDVWAAAALLVGVAAWLYLSSFLDARSAMGVGEQGGWGSGGDPGPPWFLDAMLTLREPFSFPGSLLTVLDSVWALPALGAYLAASTIGPDFWWGTMRSILIARRSRAAYLVQRVTVIFVVALGSLLVIFGFAAIVQPVLVAVAGERFPPGSLDVGTFAGLLAARLAAVLAFTLIAVTLTLVARSLPGGIVLLVLFVAADLVVGAIATGFGHPIVHELTLSGASTSIVEQLRPPPLEMVVDYELGALVPAAHQPTPPVHLFSIQASAAVVAAWVAFAGALAWTRIKSMDIAD